MNAANEKTIMDCACEHADKMTESQMINKVRIIKRIIFRFETIGSNGRKPLESFYNQEVESQYKVINWLDVEKSAPAKKEFKIWNKFITFLRQKKTQNECVKDAN